MRHTFFRTALILGLLGIAGALLAQSPVRTIPSLIGTWTLAGPVVEMDSSDTPHLRMVSVRFRADSTYISYAHIDSMAVTAIHSGAWRIVPGPFQTILMCVTSDGPSMLRSRVHCQEMTVDGSGFHWGEYDFRPETGPSDPNLSPS
jgi:hypothetical protein